MTPEVVWMFGIMISVAVFACLVIILRWVLGTAEMIRLMKEQNNLAHEQNERLLELLQIFQKAKINGK